MRTIEDIRKDVHRSRERFLEVMKYGDAVIGGYDLSMGYDADFYLNRPGLLGNHIMYHNRELKKALRYGQQACLF